MTHYITTQHTKYGVTIRVRTGNEQLNNTERAVYIEGVAPGKIALINHVKSELDKALHNLGYDKVGG